MKRDDILAIASDLEQKARELREMVDDVDQESTVMSRFQEDIARYFFKEFTFGLAETIDLDHPSVAAGAATFASWLVSDTKARIVAGEAGIVHLGIGPLRVDFARVDVERVLGAMGEDVDDSNIDGWLESSRAESPIIFDTSL